MSRAPTLPECLAANSGLLATAMAIGAAVSLLWPAPVHIGHSAHLVAGGDVFADTWHITKANLLVAGGLVSGICTLGSFTVVVLAWNGYVLGHGLATLARTAPDVLPLLLTYVPLEFGAFVLVAAASHLLTFRLIRGLVSKAPVLIGAPMLVAAVAVGMLLSAAVIEARVALRVGDALIHIGGIGGA